MLRRNPGTCALFVLALLGAGGVYLAWRHGYGFPALIVAGAVLCAGARVAWAADRLWGKDG